MMKIFKINGKIYEKALDAVGLTLNANSLPGDNGGAFKPNGVRLGTPAITTRGLKEPEMLKIAEWMKKVAIICQKADTDGFRDTEVENLEELKIIKSEVCSLAKKFPVPTI